MNDEVRCDACGEPVTADSRFCEHCGSKIELGEPRDRPVEAFTPVATELASQVLDQLKTPVVATALVGGVLAAAGIFGIGLIFGLLFSDQSLLGLVDQNKGVIGAGFAQMLNFLQVGYGGGVGKLGPALFLLLPIAACALAAVAQAHRTQGLAPQIRLLGGAAVGVVFGLLMLVPALAAGDLGGPESTIGPNVLSALVLGMLWGALGGLLGTYHVVGDELAPGFVRKAVPAVVVDVARTVYVALRPLAVVLVLMTLAATVTWTAETLLKSGIRGGSSTVVATVDNAAYAVEHGLHWTELGGLAQFRLVDAGVGGGADAFPVPVGDTARIKFNDKGEYRVFGFSKALPLYSFAALVILLFAVMLALALYAGFAVARLRRPETQWLGGAWGALVGPIWALALVIANAFITKRLFGQANADSVFGGFLVAGIVVGAIGGFLSTGSQRRSTTAVVTGAGGQ